MIELGGNITLVGFKELGYAEFVVVKKVVGNYARKISDRHPFDGLKLSVKPIHKTEDEATKFELKVELSADGKHYHADIVEHNIFIGLDKILKKIVTQLKLD
ncbi:hypothetical protein JXA48_04445 [Candidatus Woesearchaeota archaeon]|nr:hypothetical protein [Candidatus Woesearchaeota archaeon]